MRHMYGHLLLLAARLFGATDAEIAPRYARLPCQVNKTRKW